MFLPFPWRWGRRSGQDQDRRRRPAVELMEGRALLSMAHANFPPPSFLFTPIPETQPLAEHIHPHLTLIQNGQNITVPAGIGIGANGNLPIHTHDASGRLHVESTVAYTFRLGDFFAIWGEQFNRREFLNQPVGPNQKVIMTVNGRPSSAFGRRPLQDGEQILIQEITLPARGGHGLRAR